MDVADVGILRLDAYKALFVFTWQGNGKTTKFRFGYPLPVLSTGKAHPIFTMMSHVVAQSNPVSIPGNNGNTVDHLFDSTGNVRTDGRTGTWHISQGKIEVTFGHRTHAYPWRVFAKFAGWKSR